VYLKCFIRNYSTAGKRGHWPASKDISLPYLFTTLRVRVRVSGGNLSL